MIGGVNVDLSISPTGSPRCFFRHADNGGSGVEHAYNCRSLSTSIASLPTEDMIGRDTSLAIGRSGKRHLDWKIGHEIRNFDRVADGVDIWIVCLQVVVYLN